MQTIGKNPLLWKWVQKLITKYSRVNGITFKEGYSSVLMTFSNPNYCGTFIALMFPIAVSFIFLKISDKKRTAALWKAAGIIIAAALFITMIGSGSSAAGFSILGAGVIALIFLLSGFFHKREKASSEEDKIVQRKRRKKISLAIIGIIIVTVSVVAGISQTSYIKKTTTKIAKGTVDRRNLVSIINESANRMQVNFRNGESFELDVTIGNSHNALFKITDTAGKNIPLSWDTSKKMYTPQDSRFQMLSFEPKRYSLSSGMKDGFALHDVPNDISFIFVYDETSAEWKYYTPYGKLIKLHAVERFGFQNSENVASRRGYIWSRSIPLMKTYWFKGVGPNAFIIAFPNDDFVGSKRIGNKTLLVDKPHNVFLQTYIQTGGISAIAYLLLWILYIIQCVRLFWRTKLSSDLHKIAFGIFISMISYQIVSLTNDAVPGVQSSYWILLGFGFAVNRIIRRKTA